MTVRGVEPVALQIRLTSSHSWTVVGDGCRVIAEGTGKGRWEERWGVCVHEREKEGEREEKEKEEEEKEKEEEEEKEKKEEEGGGVKK